MLNFLMSVHAEQQGHGVGRLRAGIEYYENGKYLNAIINLETSLEALPQDDKENMWEAHFYLGLSYYLLGEDEEARKEFNKAKDIINNKLPDLDIHSPKIVELFKESLRLRVPEIEGMIFVKGGCFDMGDNFGDGDKDERPVHEVCVYDFYIGKYEVTNAEFERFISETGYVTTAEKKGTGWGISGSGKTEWGYKKGINWRHPLWPSDTINNKMNHPVVQISWDDTQEYIKWLNMKVGKKYRLPTEAEWEYAARSGGKKHKYSWGNGNPSGNIADESSKREYPDWTVWEGYDDGYVYTAPVGNFSANGFWIYDMSGNVCEWCQDIYSRDAYSKHKRDNPIYTESGSNRVIRGGSWRSGPRHLRASSRSRYTLGGRHDLLGFRLARTP